MLRSSARSKPRGLLLISMVVVFALAACQGPSSTEQTGDSSNPGARAAVTARSVAGAS